MTRRLLAFLVSFWLFAFYSTAWSANSSMRVPADWLDVTKLSRFKVIPNDDVDDTAGIQYVMNLLVDGPGRNKVIYFPPGLYLISNTIELGTASGSHLVGVRGQSVIKWAGAKSGVMLRTDGIHRSVTSGITWDGNGIAGVGIDHRSTTRFETHIIHRDSAFYNFQEAGIRVGESQAFASAEIVYQGLAFKNNKHGILIKEWNDYNNIVVGCYFSDNFVGVSALRGNVSVRNSSFERSGRSDLLLGAHSHTLVNVSSNDSFRFLETEKGIGARLVVNGMYLRISDWRDLDGALHVQARGPINLFGSRFKNSRQPLSSVFNIGGFRETQVVLNLGGNIIANGLELVGHARSGGATYTVNNYNLDLEFEFSKNPIVYRAALLPLYGYLNVIDDCGARGDGVNDDYESIESCLLKAGGDPGIYGVYFPGGLFRVTKSLHVKGPVNVLGTGYDTVIKGDHGLDPVVAVEPVSYVSFQDINFSSYDSEAIKISFSPSGAGRLDLDNVFSWHNNQGIKRGLLVGGRDKEAIINVSSYGGSVEFSSGRIGVSLFGFVHSKDIHYRGVNLSGSDYIISLLTVDSISPLRITGGCDVHIRDWYNEQTPSLVNVSGADAVTVSAWPTKAESLPQDFLSGDGSNVRAFFGGGLFGHSDYKHPITVGNQATTGRLEVSFFGSAFWYQSPVCVAKGKCSISGSIVVGNDQYGQIQGFPSVGLSLLQDAVELVGVSNQRDISLNYVELNPRQSSTPRSPRLVLIQ